MALTTDQINSKRLAIEAILKAMKNEIPEVDRIALAMAQQFEKLTFASQGLDLFVYTDGERYSRWQLLIENLQFMTDDLVQIAKDIQSCLDDQLLDVSQPPAYEAAPNSSASKH